MIAASLQSLRVDGNTRQRIEDLVRDDGYVAELRFDEYDVDLEAGATWRARRGRPRRSSR